jgi:hypothetical protein
MGMGKGRRLDLAIAAGLMAAVLLAFSGVLRNGFVNFDDPLYITGNPVTQQGLSPSTVAWAFTTGFAANWHPLTWLSVMLDVELFGLEPSGHHAMSLGLHALSTALVFAFMRRLGFSRGPGAFAAGLFGLHPLHVESVAWAAERKDVLSMALGLLTLLAYIPYAEAPSWKRMALVTGLFTLGLMAKSMLVTLPFVLLLLDWWPLRRIGSPAWIASPGVAPGGVPRALSERTSGRHLLLEKAPLFAVALVFCVVAYLVQQASGVVLERMPIASRLENGVHSYVVYLKKFLLPTQLACFYPMVDLGRDRVALSVATLAAFSFLAWRMRTTRPYALVGWLWFLGTLVPVIGFVQVGGQAYADRYTYLPSLGLGIAASLGLADAAQRVRLPRPAVVLAGGALLAALGLATWRQTLVWHDTAGLFEHAVVATGRNWFIRLLLASELIENSEFERAEVMLQQSLADGGPPSRIRINLSALYDREHRTQDALRTIDAALADEPDNPDMLVNRGIYLTELRRDAEAVAVLARAIALDRGNNPKQLEIARRTLATARRRLGRSGEGIPQLPEAGGAPGLPP